MKKTKLDIVKGWLRKAERDFRVAGRELERPEPYTDIVCFHAQQAAEKYLKGYLMWLEIEFEKTHDIEDLIALACRKDSSISILKDVGAELTPYAVETRYPEFEEPAVEDAKRAVKIVEELRGFILKKLLPEVKGI